MGKVFTITEGLENMGALRTGGQGSIYKCRRIGEIIVAVKLLPTPIITESNDDKNFRGFQNEVEKLKKVNEKANPNVVKILNSGITESGSFPFIEMEFIDGPDLEELLKSPHEPVFTINEVIKVASQLANALSHCHEVNVKHGDIKSNNIKFNANTGNYILLDFGLAIMSDEQRRTSLQYAGAAEFMAPEQHEGSMLFQSDIYSYGIILYELLAGSVPFPLTSNGHTARNAVMVSHIETPVPDILELRKKNLPEAWSDEKKSQEMQVPKWLLSIISKCLEKKPEDRFGNGMELQKAILAQNSSLIAANAPAILQTKTAEVNNDKELLLLKEKLARKEEELNALKITGTGVASEDTGAVSLSKPVFIALLLLIASLGAFAAYSLFSGKSTNSENIVSTQDSSSMNDVTEDNPDTVAKFEPKKEIKKTNDTLNVPAEEIAKDNEPASPEEEADNSSEKPADPVSNDSRSNDAGKVFSLFVREAYFHSQPDAGTRRNAFITSGDNARLTAIDDKNGFIYVVFKNAEGQTSKGWLNKKDLVIIGE